jgi:tetratricopeptide (TPR) repeat protein
MTITSKIFAFLRTVATLIVISSFFSALAQTADDSKEALAAAGTKEFEAAALLLINSDKESREAAVEKLNKAIDFFVKAERPIAHAGALMLRGVSLDLLEKRDAALADEQKALALFEEANLLNSQAMALNLIGSIHLKQKDFVKARDNL